MSLLDYPWILQPAGSPMREVWHKAVSKRFKYWNMLIKFNTVVAISALTITTLYSIRANAQTTLDSGNITIACAFKGSVLKDFAKRPLPGTPVLRCANGLTPSAVEVQGKVLDLYAYGTGPQPITNYGGSMRECNKLMPTGTACFTTNPYLKANHPSVDHSGICANQITFADNMDARSTICFSAIHAQANRDFINPV